MKNEKASSSATDRLARIAATLPEERIQQLVDYAEFLREQQWRKEHQAAALASFGQAFTEDEPEYTLADLKP